MTLSFQEKIMRRVEETRSTHECPECDSPAYCAMEDGKSACKCWCMHVESDFKPMFYYCQCVCKECI